MGAIFMKLGRAPAMRNTFIITTVLLVQLVQLVPLVHLKRKTENPLPLAALLKT